MFDPELVDPNVKINFVNDFEGFARVPLPLGLGEKDFDDSF
jgi:hypothetical protein